MADTIIETGVDKLVKLIERKKKITIEEAAQVLSVSTTVIQEWADFLEEEGMISVEYKLTKTYLVERKLSKKEIESKAKELTGKKEVFIRKVEGAIKGIENDTLGLENIKKEFSDLQTMVSSQIDQIKGKLMQLEKYEHLKKNIDKQILDQHKDFKSKISILDKEIMTAQKSYQDIINDINLEKTKLDEEKIRAGALKEQEDKLTEKINLIEEIVIKLKKQIHEEDSFLDNTESHINRLENLAKSASNDIEKKKSKLKDLIDDSKQKENEILKMQQEVLGEIAKKEIIVKKNVVNTEDVTKRFENFFKKKNEINVILDKIMLDRESLKRELNSIAKTAFAFELSSKSGSTKTQVTELEKRFGELDRKRDLFKKSLERLKKLITS